jgi:hypothetical protein
LAGESQAGRLVGAVEATIAFDATHAEVKAAGASAGQVQLAKGKLRLTGAQNFWTKAPLPPEAVAAFALPVLGLPERAALVYALSGKKL